MVNPSLNFDLKGKYLYLDSSGNIQEENKQTGIWAGFKRMVYVLFGMRDYRLSAVLGRVLEIQDGKIQGNECLVNKTFRTLKFSDKESDILSRLIQGKDVTLDSQMKLGSFNKKLTKKSEEVKSIFSAAKSQALFDTLRAVTYKTSLMATWLGPKKNAASSMGLAEIIDHHLEDDQPQTKLKRRHIYRIDKLADFHAVLEGSEKIKLSEGDRVRTACKRADELRKAIFKDISTDFADIIAYDEPTIHDAGLWKYTMPEKAYFVLKGSSIGHIAIEYHNGDERYISHMMEKYEHTGQKLHHLLFQRYQLDLLKLLTPEAKEALGLANQNKEDARLHLRNIFNKIVKDHIRDEQPVLKKATNSVLNQIISAIRPHRWIVSTNHYEVKPYKKTMLCSEYAQLTLINCLNLLDKELILQVNEQRKRQGLEEIAHAIALPLDKHDQTLAMPADFLEKWEDFFIKVERPDGFAKRVDLPKKIKDSSGS